MDIRYPEGASRMRNVDPVTFEDATAVRSVVAWPGGRTSVSFASDRVLAVAHLDNGRNGAEVAAALAEIVVRQWSDSGGAGHPADVRALVATVDGTIRGAWDAGGRRAGISIAAAAVVGRELVAARAGDVSVLVTGPDAEPRMLLGPAQSAPSPARVRVTEDVARATIVAGDVVMVASSDLVACTPGVADLCGAAEDVEATAVAILALGRVARGEGGLAVALGRIAGRQDEPGATEFAYRGSGTGRRPVQDHPDDGPADRTAAPPEPGHAPASAGGPARGPVPPRCSSGPRLRTKTGVRPRPDDPSQRSGGVGAHR